MLDVNTTVKTSYCIPIWQRDLQIAHAIKTVKGRIQAHYDLRQDSCAVVGFGPSLNDTLEQVRSFKYIFTCSGSHKFLIERGIVPTWHVEVDPRKHKVGLMGQPHPDVEYLVASTCHPEVFKHLENYNVKLWHVFDNSEEGLRTLPRGEWAITGGCDVGLRAMTISRFFGFTDLHIFGLDGSSPNETHRHAAEHPKQFKLKEIECNGRRFYTSEGMLAAAQSIWHELDMMPDVTPHFYGDGLIQEMFKTWERKPVEKLNSMGFRHTELISAEYCELNQKLHASNLAYGVGGGRHAETVEKIAKSLGAGASVLDYGCGKGLLAKELSFPIWQYDPAIPEYSAMPRAADLVVCTDVLEHVEPDKLDDVLTDLKRCVKQVGYFTVHITPSMKTLADGRNSHLIIEKPEWWKKKLEKYFFIGKMFPKKFEVTFVVGAKPLKVKKAA